ncbi:hypothetical protein A3H84_00155 [Candidatus Roizmanbacteria bacterium RIFCSPLOWO2_02_FULL_40_13]|nr:MAG: hypothetical protein A3H84_00155 [Candidatus Roizmanbacteria bacterium RIFCSPLOWO2_02_FULL_40_13]
MILRVFTDGGSKGNPGPAAIGYIGYVDGQVLFKGREDLGVATNNAAEYTAVVRALEKIRETLKRHSGKPEAHPESDSGQARMTKVTKIELSSDSRLLVNQVNGLFKVKNGKIKEYILAIRGLELEIGLPISYINIPREENTAADDLVNNIG